MKMRLLISALPPPLSKPMNTKQEDSTEQNEQMICPSCQTPNEPFARHCSSCHFPLDSTVMLGPLGQIEAQGIACRAATLGNPTLITVIGIWFIFFPIFVASGCIAAAEILGNSVPYFGTGSRLISVIMPTLSVVLSLVILYKTTANYWRQRRSRKSTTQA